MTSIILAIGVLAIPLIWIGYQLERIAAALEKLAAIERSSE